MFEFLGPEDGTSKLLRSVGSYLPTNTSSGFKLSKKDWTAYTVKMEAKSIRETSGKLLTKDTESCLRRRGCISVKYVVAIGFFPVFLLCLIAQTEKQAFVRLSGKNKTIV